MVDGHAQKGEILRERERENARAGAHLEMPGADRDLEDTDQLGSLGKRPKVGPGLFSDRGRER